MEGVIAWLNQPLAPGGSLRIWMAFAAGAVVLAAAIAVLWLVRMNRQREKMDSGCRFVVLEECG